MEHDSAALVAVRGAHDDAVLEIAVGQGVPGLLVHPGPNSRNGEPTLNQNESGPGHAQTDTRAKRSS
jgi:hypothetical protein